MQALIFMLLVFCCIKHFLLAHLLIIIIFVISCVCALNKACAIDEIDVRVWSCWFKYFTPKHIESLHSTATGTKYKQRSSKNRTQNKIRNKKRESKIDTNEIMNVSYLFLSHDLITKQARQGRHASSFVLVLIFCCSLSKRTQNTKLCERNWWSSKLKRKLSNVKEKWTQRPCGETTVVRGELTKCNSLCVEEKPQ